MVKCIEVCDVISVNCYIYSNDKTNHAYIIDPGAEEDKISLYLEENHLIPDKILITHGHFDHIGAVDSLREKYNIDAYVFKDDFVTNIDYNLSCYYRPIIVHYCKKYDSIITLNDGSLPLEVINVPGHTDDSVMLYSKKDNLAFTGDLVFHNGIGSFTFPTGNRNTLFDSIYNKVFTLPNDTVLYPGHEESTNVINEKEFHGKI